jgi:hypothetical protein
MSQVFTNKQQSFVQRMSNAAVALLAANDALVALTTEFTADFYGSGGANALTDTVVQTVLPASTAALFDSGEAAIVAVLSTVSSNRGTLEMLRP